MNKNYKRWHCGECGDKPEKPCNRCPGKKPQSDCGSSSGCGTKSNCGGCNDCADSPAICHKVVQTREEAKAFPNAYVLIVGENNTVVHTDASGFPLTVNSPDVYEPNHVPSVGAHTSTMVHDHINNKTYVYDPSGAFYTLNGV